MKMTMDIMRKMTFIQIRDYTGIKFVNNVSENV